MLFKNRLINTIAFACMPAVQSAYTDTFRVGFPGMIADSELTNVISRTLEGAALPFGQPVLQGTKDHTCILAKQETYEALAGSVAAFGTNTGNGTMGAITVTAGAKLGTYTLEIIEPGANTGTFMVSDPDGVLIGHGVVGSAFSAGGIAFTLADGSTDFVSGDGFTFAVTPTAATDVGDLLGISVRDLTLLHDTPDQYQAPDNVAILTQGLIWVTAGATLAPGDPVFWNPATSRFTKTATHLAIPRCRYETSATNGNLVLLAARQRLSTT